MEQPTILIVEDEIIISQATQLSLESLGYKVVDAVITGREAIDRARSLHPDIIIMDIFLPGDLDGVETAARIRSELSIPVIFATALGDSETIARARETGPYGFIIKPYDKADLQAAIEMALHKAATERKIIENERWLTMTMDNMRDAVITTDRQGLVRSSNPVTLMYMDNPAGQKLHEVVRIVSDSGADILGVAIAEARELTGECMLETDLVGSFAADITFKPIHVQPDNELLGFLFTYADITDRRKHEQEREDLIEELRSALESVKTLSGLLPICAQCKKIRDDSGYWKQVEDYIGQHAEVEFTHGLCPDCAKAIYNEIHEKDGKS